MKFNKTAEIKNFLGATLVRLVEDADGVPIVNPSLEELQTYLPGYAGEEEPKYTAKRKLSFGYTDFVSQGGKKIVKQADVDAGLLDEDTDVEPVEVDEAKVTFIIEFEYKKTVVKGAKSITETVTDRKLMTFRFANGNIMYKNGNTKVMFNSLGQMSNMSDDGVYTFSDFDTIGARPAFIGTNGLDFRDLIGFMYAYSTQRPGKYNLLGNSDDFNDGINWEDVLQGDASTIQDRFIAIHEFIKVGEVKLYGATVLFTVTSNEGTRNRSIQTYYNIFEKGIKGESGILNNGLGVIKSKIANSEKPSKSNGKIYSPAMYGTLVGVGGMVKYGLTEYKEEHMDFLRAPSIDEGGESFDNIGDIDF